MLQIQVSEIEKALARLLETLRETNPNDLTLGQLSDDLQELGRIADGQAPPVAGDFLKMGW